MSDLTEFLLARIAEDELLADVVPMVRFSDNPRIETHSPTRVRAECEAKRRIVELHDSTHECDGPNLVADPDVEDWSDGYGGPCYTLTALASIYAGHPDFREEWKS